MATLLQRLRVGDREFVWGSRTYVMGILNVTPDSFSGDGLVDLRQAVARARQIEAEGADLLDVGGESTRPETWSGPGLPAEVEVARVLPVIQALRGSISIPMSVDTYKAEVAEAAVAAGAQAINDVWGLKRDPAMARVAGQTGVPLVLVHNQPVGASGDLMADVIAGLTESIAMADAAGVRGDRIICDPGIGFAKTGKQNLELIRRLAELRRLGFPLLVGPSRKRFIGATLDAPADDRLEGTAAAVALSIAGGADLVRVHDVWAMVRVVRMADAIVRT